MPVVLNPELHLSVVLGDEGGVQNLQDFLFHSVDLSASCGKGVDVRTYVTVYSVVRMCSTRGAVQWLEAVTEIFMLVCHLAHFSLLFSWAARTAITGGVVDLENSLIFCVLCIIYVHIHCMTGYLARIYFGRLLELWPLVDFTLVNLAS